MPGQAVPLPAPGAHCLAERQPGLHRGLRPVWGAGRRCILPVENCRGTLNPRFRYRKSQQGALQSEGQGCKGTERALGRCQWPVCLQFGAGEEAESWECQERGCRVSAASLLSAAAEFWPLGEVGSGKGFPGPQPGPLPTCTSPAWGAPGCRAAKPCLLPAAPAVHPGA